MENKREVLLKVDHLCQYFRLGRKDLKAVDDVSFEIKKGEAFGLVGESGCGKTTTGRSIIKLYNINSGKVYFKGQIIGAGTRSYKDAIAKAKADAKKEIKALSSDPERKDENKAKIEEIKANLIAQLTAPVRWTQIVEQMTNDGFAEFTELGPGTVLQGLVRKISSSAVVESRSAIEQ